MPWAVGWRRRLTRWGRGIPLALLGSAALASGALIRWAPWWATGLVLFSFLGVFLSLESTRSRFIASAGILLLALSGFAGSSPDIPSTLTLGEQMRFRGRIVSDPALVKKGYRADVEVEAEASPYPTGKWSEASGLVTLTVREAGKEIPNIGDRVIFRCTLYPPTGFRNPGSLWHELGVVRKGIAARGYADAGATVLTAAPAPEEEGFQAYRRRMSLAIAAGAPGPAGGALRSITLGDRSGITQDTYELFRRTGTVHLLSVSGLHLGVVLLFSLLITRWLLLRWTSFALARPVEPYARLLAMIPVAGYAFVSGLSTATLRSLWMAAFIVLGGVVYRRISTLAVLSSTIFVILLFNPLAVTDAGLELSFAALVGLFWLAGWIGPPQNAGETSPLFTPAWKRAVRKSVRYLWGLLAASASATLMTAPLAAFHFGQGGWSGMVYNGLAVPISGFVTMPLALLGGVIYPLSGGLAAILWKLSGWSMDFLFWVFGLWNWDSTAATFTPFDTVWGVIGVYVVILGSLKKGAGFWAKAGAVALGVALVFMPKAGTWAYQHIDQKGHFYIFDVEDGFSGALLAPGGRWLVVDGGGLPGSSLDVGGEVVWPALRVLGCGKIDVVVSTHPHPDHLSGLLSLVKLGRPREIWLPEGFRGDPRYDGVLEAGKEIGATPRWIGNTPHLAELGNISLEVFAGEGKSENDKSLLVRAAMGKSAILFPGDVEAAEQKRLLLAGALKAEAPMLVASHHGSSDAVERGVLKAMNPSVVFVSCGDRRNLPSRELLSAAAENGFRVVSTKDWGAIVIDFDPEGYTYRPAPR